MQESTILSREDLLKEINSRKWVHSIDLGDGIITPGRWKRPNPLIAQAVEATDFKGKNVLDIGCWDGLWSFEAEKRGAAKVYATDDLSQRNLVEHDTFSLAHRVLRSHVKYFPHQSVFDIKNIGCAFDIVFFCGVYYHLKNPLLALARLRAVMKPGAILIIEGDVLQGHDQAFAKFYYKDWLVNDASNWWVPTIPCLRQWVECSFFEIENEYSNFAPKNSLLTSIKEPIKRLLGRRKDIVTRHVLRARAVNRMDPNYIYLDEDLRECDLNPYPSYYLGM